MNASELIRLGVRNATTIFFVELFPSHSRLRINNKPRQTLITRILIHHEQLPQCGFCLRISNVRLSIITKLSTMFRQMEFIQKLFRLFIEPGPGPPKISSFSLIFRKMIFYRLINQFMVKCLKFHMKNEKKICFYCNICHFIYSF